MIYTPTEPGAGARCSGPPGPAATRLAARPGRPERPVPGARPAPERRPTRASPGRTPVAPAPAGSSMRPTLARMAAAPFALFELCFPGQTGAASPTDAGRGPAARRPARRACRARCDVVRAPGGLPARRLVEARTAGRRVVLRARRPTRSSGWRDGACRSSRTLASSPDVIRPRWPAHPQFWQMLVGAARRDSPAALQWAHCVGVCLLGRRRTAADRRARRGAPRR